jgi:hypothetical protein
VKADDLLDKEEITARRNKQRIYILLLLKPLLSWLNALASVESKQETG